MPNCDACSTASLCSACGGGKKLAVGGATCEDACAPFVAAGEGESGYDVLVNSVVTLGNCVGTASTPPPSFVFCMAYLYACKTPSTPTWKRLEFR